MTQKEVLLLLQDSPNDSISKFLKDFDTDFKKEVVDLYKNKRTFDEWYKLAEQYKKNKEMQIALVLHPDVPDDIVYKVVANKSYQDVYKAIITCKTKSFTPNVIRKCLDEINPKTLSSLYEWDSAYRPVQSINETASNEISKRVIQKLLKNGTTELSKEEIHCINFFNDSKLKDQEGFIKKILENDNLQENFLSAIANNKNISEDIRNKAFDMGVNYLLISNTTPYMLKTMYESSVDMALNPKEYGFTTAISSGMSTILIRHLMDVGLPLAYQRDLAARMISLAPNRVAGTNLMDDFIFKITDGEIIRDIANTEFAVKNVYTKIAMCETTPDDVAMGILRKASNNIAYSEKLDIHDTGLIADTCERRTFSDEIYKLLLHPIETGDKKKIESLDFVYNRLINDKTPDEIIEKIGEGNQYINPEIYHNAISTLVARQNGLDKHNVAIISRFAYTGSAHIGCQYDEIDLLGIMDTMSYIKEKYSSEHHLFNKMDAIQKYLYEQTIQCFVNFVCSEKIDSYREKLNYKFEAYLLEDKLLSELNELEEKTEKIVDAIYMEYREEFDITEEQMCYDDADRDFI